MTADTRSSPEATQVLSGMDDLLSRITAAGARPVTFLFGSALTMGTASDVACVPGVRAMVEMLEEQLGTRGGDKFNAALSRAKADGDYASAYRAGFEAIIRRGAGQDAANRLIRRAVLKAHVGTEADQVQQQLLEARGDGNLVLRVQNEPRRWKPLSPSLDALGRLLTLHSSRFPRVLTTNFDPLIDVAIRRAGGHLHQTLLAADGSPEQHFGSGTHVVHLHGHWLATDTLHVDVQLGKPRPRLERTLRSWIENSLLVVMGYAGWDDVLMRTLRSASGDGSAGHDIAWAFYGGCDQRVVESLGGQSTRLQVYEHIDVHKFLPALLEASQHASPSAREPAAALAEPPGDSAPGADGTNPAIFAEIPLPSGGRITTMAWSPDGAHVAVHAQGLGIIICPIEPDPLRRTRRIQESEDLSNPQWLPDSSALIAWSRQRGLARIRLNATPTIETIPDFPTGASCFAVSPDRFAIAYGIGQEIWVLELSEPGEPARHRLAAKLDVPQPMAGVAVYPPAWSRDGSHLAIPVPDGAVIVDTTLGDSARRIVDSEQETRSERDRGIAIMLTNANEFCLARGASVGVHDRGDGRLLRRLLSHSDSITAIAESQDGAYLATKARDGTLCVWDSSTWQIHCVLASSATTHSLPFNDIAFHPTQPLLAAPDRNGTSVRIWNLAETGPTRSASPRTVQYVSIRIALVGDTSVGKTHLGHRIAHNEFGSFASTHGQQFWVVDDLGLTRGDGTLCEAVLWDFAGQHDYRIVHACFLEDIALALVLFDGASHDDPLRGVPFWLRQLSEHPKILVSTKADRSSPSLSEHAINEYCRTNGITNYVATSAKSGDGVAKLRGMIRKAVDWDSRPATTTTATFKRIKDRVLSLKAQAHSGVIVADFPSLHELLRQDVQWGDVTDSELLAAVEHLARHGYVSVLQDEHGRTHVLLDPTLLINLASSLILEARRNPQGLGAIQLRRIRSLELEFEELRNLSPQQRVIIVDSAVGLFIRRALCFRAHINNDDLLVFPELINQLPQRADKIGLVDGVTYRITGAVTHVYPTLVVLLGYSGIFTRVNQWKDHALYRHDDLEVCGIQVVTRVEDELDLVLSHGTNTSMRTRLVFQALVERILGSRPNLSIDRFPILDCPHCSTRQPRDTVIRRIASGKQFVRCEECDSMLDLPGGAQQLPLAVADRAAVVAAGARGISRAFFESAAVRVLRMSESRSSSRKRCIVCVAPADVNHSTLRQLVSDLRGADIEVVESMTPGWVPSSAGYSDWFLLIATPNLPAAYEDPIQTTSSLGRLRRLVEDEVDASAPTTSFPVTALLLSGDPALAIPGGLSGVAPLDFRDEGRYFCAVLDLLLLVHRIDFGDGGVADIRWTLQQMTEGTEPVR